MPGAFWPQPFVGRSREVALLDGLLDSSARGEGWLCLIAGAPGAGKTRLLLELTDRARAAGWLVLAGEAFDSEAMPPYALLVDALRPFVLQCAAGELGDLLGRDAWAIARLLPELRPRLPGLTAPEPLSPEFERFRLFESVSSPILRLASSTAAAGQPGLLLLLDGLQPSDLPVLHLLAHLSSRLREAPLCVVATYRDTGPGRIDASSPAFDLLAGARPRERLRLEGLTGEDIALVLRACLGEEQPAEPGAEIGSATAGNALFVAEVARLLAAERSEQIGSGGSRAGWRTALTDDLASFAGRRLDHCLPSAYRLLSTAALFGRECSRDEIEQAAGLGDLALSDALSEAESAGLLSVSTGDPARLRFTDPLLRDLLLGHLRGSERTRLHAAIGAALERAPKPESERRLAELAYHLSQAAPIGGPQKTIAYGRDAGDLSMAQFAYETAIRQYSAALRAFALQADASPAERCDLLLRLAAAQQGAGESATAREIWLRAAELAGTLPAPEPLARAALGAAGTSGSSGIGDPILARLLEEALAALADQPPAARAPILSRLAMQLTYLDDAPRAAELSQEAAYLARSAGDPRALGAVLVARQQIGHEPGSSAERGAFATDLLLLAEAHQDREMALQGHHLRLLAALELAEVATVDDELAAHAGLADELALPFYRWRSVMERAMLAILRGDPAAEELIDAALTTSGGAVPGAAAATVQRLVLHREQARLPELLGRLDALVEQQPAVPTWRAALSWLHAETGNAPLAQAELDGLAANDFGRLPRDENWLPAAACLAEACSILDAADGAHRLYQVLLPYAGQVVVTGGGHACMGAVDRFLGLLARTSADLPAAEAHLLCALDMHRRMGARALEARTLYDLALVCLSQNETAAVERARDLLGASQATALQLNMPRLQQQIDALGAAAGLVEAHDHARAPDAKQACLLPDRLTPREAEVLALIASGRSNNAIADALMVSVRTIEHHITNIYAKIGARGKADATAYAVRHGLTDRPAPTGS